MDLLLFLWRPVLEILFIWVLVYSVIRFVQGTRAMQVLMGLVILAIIFNIAKFLELNTINWVLAKLFAVGVLAFLIIFQPEMRRALARIGQKTMVSNYLQEGGTLDEVVKACEYLSKHKIGGLIAIERDIGLRNYIEGGVEIDAKVNAELLMTIFNTHTPTHDGGVVIVSERIASCSSFFPLSQSMEISSHVGTRHRAAIGLTEETDAVCVVVSEETGGISVSVYGKLTRNLDGEGLRRVLTSLFKPTENKWNFKDLGRSWKLLKPKG